MSINAGPCLMSCFQNVNFVSRTSRNGLKCVYCQRKKKPRGTFPSTSRLHCYAHLTSDTVRHKRYENVTSSYFAISGQFLRFPVNSRLLGKRLRVSCFASAGTQTMGCIALETIRLALHRLVFRAAQWKIWGSLGF